MTPRRWLVLVLLVGGMVAVQRFGLDRQPEAVEEEHSRRVPEIAASDMVPTYIASLFFGAFRAVVVDALWIQLKKVEEERRWYEQKEILELISYFQPRNPEVWSHLGWHSAYNIANGFTDPDKSWEWVKFGLKWLRRGNAMLPDSPYLKYELARTLYHKPSWRIGFLDRNLLQRVEGDAELQELLRLGAPGPRPMSSFELAIPWLERAREELFQRKEKYVLTQVGLYVRPLTMDGFIRECLFYQAMYDWQLQRWEETQEGFRRASVHTEGMIQKAYDEPMSSIFKDWVKFYARLPEIVDLDRRSRDGTKEDVRAFLVKLQGLLVDMGPLDEGFLWNRQPKSGRLDELKQLLSGGRDLQECNDSFDMATELVEGELLQANMEPQGLDVDYYRLTVGAPAPAAPTRGPIPLRIRFRRPDSARLDLKVTLFDPSRRPVREAEMRGELLLEHACEGPGAYFLRVEPLRPADPWPDRTDYTLQHQTGS